MRTRNTGVVSSNAARVTIKTPLVMKATGSHFIKSTPLEKTQSPVSGYYCARNQLFFAVCIDCHYKIMP